MGIHKKKSFFENWPVALVVFAVIYNALLALLNAHVMPVSRFHTVVCEFIVLAIITVFYLKTEKKKEDIVALAFLYFVVISALIISLVNVQLFVDLIRHCLIIVGFYLLGTRLNENNIHKIFFIVSFLVALVLAIEIIDISTYVTIFQPALYFNAAKGMALREYNQLGIFAAALGYEGRFSYGLYDGPRTSSLFLEQVSLSNFAVILAMYVSLLGKNITTFKKIFYVLLVFTILVTSQSRAALGFTVLIIILHYIISYIPKVSSFIILPVAILVTVLIHLWLPPTYSFDSLPGRLNHTADLLLNSDLPSYFALKLSDLPLYGDSGIGYIINSGSIIFLLIIWVYLATILPIKYKNSFKALMYLNIYFWGLLSVSGTSVFSMKTAVLLWVMIGYISVSADKDTLKL